MEERLNYPGNASWIEISKKALRNNVETFRSIAKDQFSVGFVLKGNSYGHGLENVFTVIQSLTDCVYVITAQDAFQLRKIEKDRSFTPSRIVVMGALTSEEIIECSKLNIELVLGDLTWISAVPALRKAGTRAMVHIHIDTGLSREGFNYKTISKELEFLKDAQDVISVKGAMSHFANTEDVTEQSYALAQVAAFKEGVATLRTSLALTDSIEEHLSASAAALVLPEARMSRVRIGISLYGFWPSAETRISAKLVLHDLPRLEPALSWKCQSQIVKWVQKRTYVGYGCTYRCEQDSWIAVLPVGYYDGYPRLASGKAYVLVNGKRCPIIGRVMMNHLIVNVTHATSDASPIEAVLIGKDGDEVLTAETLAKWAETIQYEVVTRLGAHLKRILVD